MPRENLDISQRAPDRRYLSRGVGDEGPSPAVAGTAVIAERAEPLREHQNDHMRAGRRRPLGCDHIGRGATTRRRRLKLDQRSPQLAIERHDSSRSTLAGDVTQMDRVADLAACICHHVPCERCYLLGAEARLHRQKDDDAIAEGVADRGDVAKRPLDLPA